MCVLSFFSVCVTVGGPINVYIGHRGTEESTEITFYFQYSLNEENDDEPVAQISLFKNGSELFQDVKLPKKVKIDGDIHVYHDQIVFNITYPIKEDNIFHEIVALRSSNLE